MKKLLFTICLLACAAPVFAQKGVDPQTKQIREDSNKTNKGNDVNRSIDWGSGKTKTREMLPNPYKFNGRRDFLVNNILSVLKDKQILIDDAASRLNEGIIVTQPYVFVKGSVTARSQLSRYAVLPGYDSVWSRGRYTLTIEVQPIDGTQNNVSVLAKIEGRQESGVFSEWTTLQSNGALEDEFLAKLIEYATGVTPEPIVTRTP
jgi:Ni/Co efflux regulator RcnB